MEESFVIDKNAELEDVQHTPDVLRSTQWGSSGYEEEVGEGRTFGVTLGTRF
jgi:hypothetical protein